MDYTKWAEFYTSHGDLQLEFLEKLMIYEMRRGIWDGLTELEKGFRVLELLEDFQQQVIAETRTLEKLDEESDSGVVSD